MLLACAVLFARRRFEHVATSMALDGIVGALACAAVAVTLLQETLQDLTQAGTPHAALVTNLLYPITDLLLLIVILGLLTAAEWRPPPVLVVVSLGVVGFAVVDSVFLYESTAGSYRPGTPLASLSLLATALIAAAAWVPPQAAAASRARAARLLLPLVFALVCLGVLVVAAVHTRPARRGGARDPRPRRRARPHAAELRRGAAA